MAFFTRCFLMFFFQAAASSAQPDPGSDAIERRNKAIATDFYESLWFSNNTDRYADFFHDDYVVHDTGERKGVTEPAIEQKLIADFFHENGVMTGEVDYQIADGDLVATRWSWRFEPTSLMFKAMGGRNEIPIINVFRFDSEGKIVEIWNHRHDIDTGAANVKLLKGLAIGAVATLASLIAAWVYRRRWLQIKNEATTGES
ncbi:MAG: nuclear transport factor 2 family protein [Pseudomonadota bacterium]